MSLEAALAAFALQMIPTLGLRHPSETEYYVQTEIADGHETENHPFGEYVPGLR